MRTTITFSPISAMLLGLLTASLVGCNTANSIGIVEPNTSGIQTKVETQFTYKGHDYMVFSAGFIGAGSPTTTVVHDPDCKGEYDKH